MIKFITKGAILLLTAVVILPGIVEAKEVNNRKIRYLIPNNTPSTVVGQTKNVVDNKPIYDNVRNISYDQVANIPASYPDESESPATMVAQLASQTDARQEFGAEIASTSAKLTLPKTGPGAVALVITGAAVALTRKKK